MPRQNVVKIDILLTYEIPGNMDIEAINHIKSKLESDVIDNEGVNKLLDRGWLLSTAPLIESQHVR